MKETGPGEYRRGEATDTYGREGEDDQRQYNEMQVSVAVVVANPEKWHVHNEHDRKRKH